MECHYEQLPTPATLPVALSYLPVLLSAAALMLDSDGNISEQLGIRCFYNNKNSALTFRAGRPSQPYDIASPFTPIGHWFAQSITPSPHFRLSTSTFLGPLPASSAPTRVVVMWADAWSLDARWVGTMGWPM